MYFLSGTLKNKLMRTKKITETAGIIKYTADCQPVNKKYILTATRIMPARDKNGYDFL